MTALKLACGAFSVLLGLGYLFRPDIIERLNAVLRETIFNDAYIALERKKWGAFFCLIGILLLYMGLSAARHQFPAPRPAPARIRPAPARVRKGTPP